MNGSFQNIQAGMLALQSGIGTMRGQVKTILTVDGQILGSIGLLVAASEETSGRMRACRQTIGEVFVNLGRFSPVIVIIYSNLKKCLWCDIIK